MKRFLILNGDSTTSNGVIHATATTIQLNGEDVAHEGDEVACPACNTTGKIQCDGARQIMTAPDGRRAALSDDLCICACQSPPRLVSSQQGMSVET
ncbi:PAAR domain-containing protein [Paraburkholderia fungorum]|uniref:PAAR domain-containing protein n=1 Tax=Paraburkholderia fungorum TaxID=134537 RepID=UPI001C1F16AA|nr:PAAR domain-containing protein [Paraburkholderia fungorum]MBU7438585.1 PAAR domain-containing protein [Paraburkholderia fungorum]